MKIRKIVLSIFLISAACQSTPPAVRLEVLTLDLLPTETISPPSPTLTHTPTDTLSPTDTSTPTLELTATQTITPTITLTPSETLIPPTFTASPIPTHTKPPPTVAPVCNCSRDYDCKDFNTQRQAQACFTSCGGSKTNNWSRLDGSDKDGKVCESLS